MTEPTRTIKVYKKTHPKLRLLAAMTGETMMELIDRLVTDTIHQLDQQENKTMTTQTTKSTVRNMTLVNVTTRNFGDATQAYMWQLEELVAEWNAEGIAYGDFDVDDLPHLHVSGDEVRYYRSNKPGDYQIVGTIIQEA